MKNAANNDSVTGYTPGPLRVGFDDGSGRGENGEGIWIIDANDDPVVFAGKDDGVPFGVLKIADAELFAAAPDLYEVLMEIMPDGFTIRDNFDGEAWLKKAGAALKKARGES